jgi:hypothetical protein
VSGRRRRRIQRVTATILVLFAITGTPRPAAAQVDTTAVRVERARSAMDSTRPLTLRGGPPISPTRAFLTSLLIPGLGQARLDRGSAGALFATVELGALAMIRRTNEQVREARRFLNDSLPTDFTVGEDGTLQPTSRAPGGFTPALVRRRRLHLEDWLAVLAFNHLLSGADAFVAAQLWDLPAAVSIFPNAAGGASVVATIHW